MVFSSLSFVWFFLPATLAAYFIIKNRTWRNSILLLFSLFFYAWGEPLYIVLMVFSIICNWGFALVINKYRKKNLLLFVGIVLNLAGIIVFKYLVFIIENINVIWHLSLKVPEISLPIGISFYTFQAISYLVDVYRGDVTPQRNPLFFGTYLAMFPQLIAGPIVRYTTIEKEILLRNESVDNFSHGMRRFIIGLSKKVLIANTMGKITDAILVLEPSSIGSLLAWCAFIAYSFQIYFDFSGYSDMALGLGKIFGFHFDENFNYPYVARSITDFWRRWHMSLSSFFRDYLYIPLGGNRVKRFRFIINLLIVWTLTGLWHGANWNFLFWGAYFGLVLIGEKIIWGETLKKAPVIIQHAYTIFFVVIAWVIFRAENLSQMIGWFYALFGKNGWGNISTLNVLNVIHYYPWFIIAIIGSTPAISKLLHSKNSESYWGWLFDFYILTVFCWSIISLGMGGFNPFIYFRF